MFFKTDRLVYQAAGIGLAVSAFPLGRNTLSYGESSATDREGNDLGTFEPVEKYKYFGLGVSLSTLLEEFRPSEGHLLSHLSGYGDVAMGIAYKDVQLEELGPLVTKPYENVEGEGSATDIGVLARLTPINSLEGKSLLPFFDSAFEPLGGVQVDASYGFSRQSSGENSVKWSIAGQSDRIPTIENSGWGLHAAIGLPVSFSQNLEASGRGHIARSLSPMIEWGWSKQYISQHWPETSDDREIDNSGWEVTLFNILTIRRGTIDDPRGDIQDSTSGWGLGYERKGLGGIRFDRAEVPQASALDRVTRNSFALFVDPVALSRRLR